jgi:transcription antitermination factor NusG
MSTVPQLNEVTGPMFAGESAASPALNQILPAEYLEPRWYAAYTCARHEKRVAELLRLRGVESFLPLYERVHRWKNRQRMRVQLPLFPGYVFVRLALKDRLQVLQLPSVVRLVGFNRTPTPLPEQEIESLRAGLGRLHAEPHPYLKTGRRVRIQGGPLRGLEGIVVRGKGKSRIVISIDLILRSVVVDLDAGDLGLT